VRDALLRSNGAFKAPVVIRVAIGGYLTGGGVYHSQSGESISPALPGLACGNAFHGAGRRGSFAHSHRCDDPVMFLEHKHLYRQPYNRSEHPGPILRFRSARRIVKEGSDLSIITYGGWCIAQKSRRRILSARALSLNHRPASLSPYDWEAIAATVRKTHRVIVAYKTC